MFNFQSVCIVILGIIVSFLLFAEGEKYNAESTEYGRIIQYCEEQPSDCQYRMAATQQEFEEKYGAAYWVHERNLREQKIYVIIPCVILIITLFVCFTLDKKEILFTGLVLAPFFIGLIVRFTFRPECCLTPFYLLYAVGLSFVFSSFKRYWLFANP